MKKLVFIFAVLLFAGFISAYAQSSGKKLKKLSSAEKDILVNANMLFDEGDYLSALPIYERLYENHPEELFLQYKIGICCLYKTDENARALEYLLPVAEKNKRAADVQFYIGRAYMLNYKFDEAIEKFNETLKQKNISRDKKTEAKQYILNCNYGKELVAKPMDVKIENLGPPINTENSEYVPIISSDESILIFTYRGEKSTGGKQNIYNMPDPFGFYYEDVFLSKKINGSWSEPVPLPENINSDRHDAAIAMSNDGQILFVYKNTPKDNGDMYLSPLQGDEWLDPDKLKGDVNTAYWEGSCSLSADARSLIFSSERPGGFGKKDLYQATLLVDGTLGDVKNLGPTINTPLDDDAPFIHPDGTTLVFSSKGHNNMGGYDIFKAFKIDTSWTKPENMGYPINTPGDDLYYVLSADGKHGYYSSGKSGGYGQQDIYISTPGLIGWKPTLILLKGDITVNSSPAESEIKVVLASNNKDVGSYTSNATTGKYLINLPAGTNYKVIYRKQGYDDQIETVNSTLIDSFSEIIHNVYFGDSISLHLVNSNREKTMKAELITAEKNTFRFLNLPSDTLLLFLLEGTMADSIREIIILVENNKYTLTRCVEKYFCLKRPVASRIIESEIPFYKAENYAELVKIFGDVKAEGLIFKVQIGAYQMPDNFKYQKLNPPGKVSRNNYADGITRFTIGSFNTLNDADKMLKKTITQGFTDAFVTAFYNGKRFSLNDLGTLKK